MDKQICQANTKKWVAVRPRWDGAPNAQVTVSESERKKIQPFGRSSAHPMETQQTLHHPPRRWASGGWTKSWHLSDDGQVSRQWNKPVPCSPIEVKGRWASTGITSLEVLKNFLRTANDSHCPMHNDIKGSSSVRCSCTHRVFVHCSRKVLEYSKTQAATICLGAKPKQDSAKTFKSLIQKTGSGGKFGRARFQLLSVRLHVNWIYWPRSSSAMKGSDMLDFS